VLPDRPLLPAERPLGGPLGRGRLHIGDLLAQRGDLDVALGDAPGDLIERLVRGPFVVSPQRRGRTEQRHIDRGLDVVARGDIRDGLGRLRLGARLPPAAHLPATAHGDEDRADEDNDGGQD